MSDHVAVLAALPDSTKQDLAERSNAAGLRHLALYVGAILVTGAGIYLRVPFWPLLLLPHGILLVFLFTLSHECTHQTPFRSKWLSDIIGHVIAPVLALPFIWFRYFHLAHHKHTNDPDKDPEIANHPRPSDWRSFLIYLSGWGYWTGMGHVLVTNAFGTINAPYLPERKHGLIRREARLILLVYAAAFATFVWSPFLIWLWLVPVLIGQPFLRLYLLAEHGLCPPVANMFENTRTTYTSALIRALAWNMPFHAEHHAAPHVPFHKLGQLNRLVSVHLQNTSKGYSSFTADYTSNLK